MGIVSRRVVVWTWAMEMSNVLERVFMKKDIRVQESIQKLGRRGFGWADINYESYERKRDFINYCIRHYSLDPFQPSRGPCICCDISVAQSNHNQLKIYS